MHSLILLAAAGLVASSPAVVPRGAINLDIVDAAPDVSATQPGAFDSTETGIYNAASASASAAAAATAVATASAAAAEKRGLEERTFCFFGFGFCGSSSSSTSSKVTTTSCTTTAKTTVAKVTSTSCTTTATSTAKATSTSTSCAKTATSTGTTTAAVTSSVTSSASSSTITSVSSGVVPSTCTPVSWTNTFAFTSDTACPSPFEVGTYCGFINPEDPCAPQPDGYGPKTTPDTADAFLANTVYEKLAKSAAVPSGYASTFTDLDAAVSANSYMGLHTLQSYDVASCAAKCDETDLCTAFNVYIERDPAWNPDQCSCTGTDVTSITNFKCTLWGSGVQPSAATNTGETRDGFQVVITGSNGYEKSNNTTPATPDGWTKPQKCSGVHDHPRTCIGEKMFKGVYDVNVCATYAAAQNAVNVKSGIFNAWKSYFGYNSSKCNFFNAFMLTKDGVAQGTYCKLFAQQYGPKVGTSLPGWTSGHYYGAETSWSFCSS